MKPGERAAVLGAGPIGLLTVMLCKLAFGASTVCLVEPLDFRREFANQWADICLTPDQFMENSHQFEVIIDAAGDLELVAKALNKMSAGGRIGLLARNGQTLTLDKIDLLINLFAVHREKIQTLENKLIQKQTQYEYLINKINELQKKDQKAKVIVMGDFNDHPDNTSILNTLKASDKPKDKGDLYNAYQTLDAAKQGTHYYDKEWRVLDQIIVSRSFIGAKKGYKFDPKNAHILRKDFVLYKNPKTGEEKPNRTYSGEKYYNGYSDHLSIYISLD
jgi:hypothetical protein